MTLTFKRLMFLFVLLSEPSVTLALDPPLKIYSETRMNIHQMEKYLISTRSSLPIFEFYQKNISEDLDVIKGLILTLGRSQSSEAKEISDALLEMKDNLQWLQDEIRMAMFTARQDILGIDIKVREANLLLASLNGLHMLLPPTPFQLSALKRSVLASRDLSKRAFEDANPEIIRLGKSHKALHSTAISLIQKAQAISQG